MKENELTPGVRLLRLPEVMQRTGLSRSHLWRLAKGGLFPQPAHFGRAAFWPSDEIDGWVASVIKREVGDGHGH